MTKSTIGASPDFSPDTKQPVRITVARLDELERVYESTYNQTQQMNFNLLSLSQRQNVCHREALHAVWVSAQQSPKRESGEVRAGDVFPGDSEVFPEGLVAVPIVQMEDIKKTLNTIVGMCQYRFADMLSPENKRINDFKGDLFCLAEHAQLFAGNWTHQKFTKTTSVEDQTS